MNILLFSDIPPCTNYTAGIVLNKMCGFLLEEGHSVSCFTVMDPSLTPDIPEDKKQRMTFQNLDKPRENWGRIKAYSFIRNNISNVFTLPKYSKVVADFAKKQNADLIWVAEQGQTIINMVRHIAKLTRKPYVVQMWDATEWWIGANHFDPITARMVLKELGRILHKAECYIAPSWEAEMLLGDKYKCKRSKAVVLGFPEGRIEPAGNKEDQFVIALSGQIYASREFEQLVKALDLLSWQYKGRKIAIRLYGRYFNLNFPFETRFELRGWKNQDELLPELADADLFYCPYWFADEYKIVSQTSFPNKLCTYLKLAKPVLFHGPEYASPGIFLREYDAAYQCNTLDEKKIAEKLCEIMDDPQRDSVGERGYKAFQDKLTDECMKRDFFEALGLIQPESTPSERARLHSLIRNSNVKVVHVNNVDLLGNRFNGYDMQRSFNAAYRWMKQLVLQKMGTDPNVDCIVSPKVLGRMEPLCTAFEQKHSIRGLIHPYGRAMQDHPFFKEADIVHYHLLHNNVLSWADMPNLTNKKPSVLTIHDPWLFTGHCLHPIECKRWLIGCGECPHLDRPFAMSEDNTALVWEVKKKIFERSDVDLIVASQWMKKLAEQSPITKNSRIHLIPFGIDLRLFMDKGNKKELREKHNISQSDFVIFFRQDPSEYKGMEYILKMLMNLKIERPITILTVGSIGLMKQLKGKFRIVEFPWITNNELMAELYTCCDVFLMPSIAEAFGMMAIEAMASSRPVIVFEGTALPEVTFAPECGISVPARDVDALEKAVTSLIDDPEDACRRGRMGRKLAEENYDYVQYIARHSALYEEIMRRNKNKH